VPGVLDSRAFTDHVRNTSQESQWRRPGFCVFFRKQAFRAGIYPPAQKTMGVGPWMNATVGPSEARRAKEGASADSAEERKGYHGCKPVEAS